MNTALKLAAIAALLTISTSAYAEGFIRPELAYTKPSNMGGHYVLGDSVDFGGKAAFGLAGGAAFGAQNENEISVVLEWAKFSDSASEAGPFTLDGVTYRNGTETVTVKTMPLLLNYRYLFGSSTSAARFYIGPAIGWTNIKVTDEERATMVANGSLAIQTGSTSTWGFTWGGSLGVVIKLARQVDADIGYRYASAKSVRGLDDLRTSTLYAGLGVRF